MADCALQVSGGPVLEFKRGLFGWAVTARGQQVRSHGLLVAHYEMVMNDRSLKRFRLVGFLNGAVEIDGQRIPVERRLEAWELVLSALPLVLAIPLVTGGILGFVLGFSGMYTNTVVARAVEAPKVRAGAMLGTTAAFLAVYVVALYFLVQVLRSIF